MKNKEIIYKNNIQKKYLNSTLNRRLNKKYSNILKNIISNLDNTKDAFHSLSKKFYYFHQRKDLFVYLFCFHKYFLNSV